MNLKLTNAFKQNHLVKYVHCFILIPVAPCHRVVLKMAVAKSNLCQLGRGEWDPMGVHLRTRGCHSMRPFLRPFDSTLSPSWISWHWKKKMERDRGCHSLHHITDLILEHILQNYLRSIYTNNIIQISLKKFSTPDSPLLREGVLFKPNKIPT